MLKPSRKSPTNKTKPVSSRQKPQLPGVRAGYKTAASPKAATSGQRTDVYQPMVKAEKPSLSSGKDSLYARAMMASAGTSRNNVSLKSNQHYLTNPAFAAVGRSEKPAMKGSATGVKPQNTSQTSLKRVNTPASTDVALVRSRPAVNNTSPSNSPLVNKAMKQLLTMVGDRHHLVDEACNPSKSRLGSSNGQSPPKATKLLTKPFEKENCYQGTSRNHQTFSKLTVSGQAKEAWTHDGGKSEIREKKGSMSSSKPTQHTLNAQLLHKTKLLQSKNASRIQSPKQQLATSRTSTRKPQDQFKPAASHLNKQSTSMSRKSPQVPAKGKALPGLAIKTASIDLSDLVQLNQNIHSLVAQIHQQSYQKRNDTPVIKKAASPKNKQTNLAAKKTINSRKLLFDLSKQQPEHRITQAHQRGNSSDSASPPSHNTMNQAPVPKAPVTNRHADASLYPQNQRFAQVNQLSHARKSLVTEQSKHSLHRNVVQQNQLLPSTSSSKKRLTWNKSPQQPAALNWPSRKRGDGLSPEDITLNIVMKQTNKESPCNQSPKSSSQANTPQNFRYSSNSARKNEKHHRRYSTFQDDDNEASGDKTLVVSPEMAYKNHSSRSRVHLEHTDKKEDAFLDEAEPKLVTEFRETKRGAKAHLSVSVSLNSSPYSNKDKAKKPTLGALNTRLSNLQVMRSQDLTPEIKQRCSMALKLIEEIENSSKREDEEFLIQRQASEARESSEDSNDSLIQTQRKLRKEYLDIQLSQSKDRTNPASSKKTLRRLNQAEMKTPVSSTKKYIKQTAIQLTDSKRDHNQRLESMTEVSNSIKFPMGVFLSASSEFEEDLIIERYSMQLRSNNNSFHNQAQAKSSIPRKHNQKLKRHKREDTNDQYYARQTKQMNEELTRQLVTESQAVQFTINSLQSLNSLKPFTNESASFDTANKEAINVKTNDPKRSSELSGIEKISIHDDEIQIKYQPERKSIVVANSSEKSPFKCSNRSPDSFIKISSNDKNEITPIHARISLLSMVQDSQKTSHISQKSSCGQQQPKTEEMQKQEPEPVAEKQQAKPPIQVLSSKPSPKQSNKVEINVEKLIQILKLLKDTMHAQQGLIQVEDERTTKRQNKEFQVKFERINGQRLHSAINLCEEWWDIIREPTVSQQLNKTTKILSHNKIQNSLRKALIYQLLFFSCTGYFYSQEQFQFAEILTELAYYTYLNFSVLCLILVEKFPQEILEKNTYAHKLNQELNTNQKMKTQLQCIQENIHLQTSNVSLSLDFKDSSSHHSQGHLSREAKHQYLKVNNKMNQNLFNKVMEIIDTQPDLDGAFVCPFVKQMKIVLASVDSQEQLLIPAIDKVGKALREDYDEEVKTNLPGKEDIQRFEEQVSQNLRVQIDNGLKLIPAPYLKEPFSKEYTLVLDLDETLLHFEELNDNEGQLSIRPGADSFLKLMSQYFNIVIFTAGTEEYADWALSFLENQNLINHRLYRQHALPYNGFYVKDLSRIGTDLRKTLIVDNIAENFQLQPYNGIFIKTWIDASDDTCLFTLAPLLVRIVKENVDDVRDFIKQMHINQDQLLDSIAFGTKSAASSKQMPDQPQAKNETNQSRSNKDDDGHQPGGKRKVAALDEYTSDGDESRQQQDDRDLGDALGIFDLGLPMQPPSDFVQFQQQQAKEEEMQQECMQFEHDGQQTPPAIQKNKMQQLQTNTIYTIIESQNEMGSSLESPRYAYAKSTAKNTGANLQSLRKLQSVDTSEYKTPVTPLGPYAHTPFVQSLDENQVPTALRKPEHNLSSNIQTLNINLLDEDEGGLNLKPLRIKRNAYYS